jgi:hypothetical protein
MGRKSMRTSSTTTRAIGGSLIVAGLALVDLAPQTVNLSGLVVLSMGVVVILYFEWLHRRDHTGHVE